MVDVFDEVDDDLRHEKLEKWWKQYGTTVIAFAIGIVLGTAIYVSVQHYRTVQAEKKTEILAGYADSLSSQVADKEETLAGLVAFGRDKGGDIGAISLLKAAENYRELGNEDEAVALYREVYGMSGVDIFYSDLALLMTVQLTMDEKSTTSVIEELKKLSNDDRPLRFTAREMLAYLYMSENELDKAQEIFVGLSTNPDTPQGLKQRAQALANITPAAGSDDEPMVEDMQQDEE